MIKIELLKTQQKSVLNNLLQISDTQLGKNYLLANDFNNDYCWVAHRNQLPLGFIIVQLIASCLNISISTAIIKTIAVDAEFQKRGIGHALMNKALLFLSGKVSLIMIIGWKNKEKPNINRLALMHHFKPESELIDYWYHDSLLKGYACPICGNPCLCSAVIYIK